MPFSAREHVAVGGVEQAEQDVLHVLAHVTGFGQ